MRVLHANGLKLKMRGGSLLLSKGGPGGASSYESEQEYHDITGKGLGLGLFAGGALTGLKSLNPKSMTVKPKNISFS